MAAPRLSTGFSSLAILPFSETRALAFFVASGLVVSLRASRDASRASFCFRTLRCGAQYSDAQRLNSRGFLTNARGFAASNEVLAFWTNANALQCNDLRRRPQNTQMQNSENSERQEVFGSLKRGANPKF